VEEGPEEAVEMLPEKAESLGIRDRPGRCASEENREEAVVNAGAAAHSGDAEVAIRAHVQLGTV
jgi:hypothetical protein